MQNVRRALETRCNFPINFFMNTGREFQYIIPIVFDYVNRNPNPWIVSSGLEGFNFLVCRVPYYFIVDDVTNEKILNYETVDVSMFVASF